MTSINLSHIPEDSSTAYKADKGGIVDVGLIISLLLLVISGAIYGSLKFYNNNLVSQKSEIDSSLNDATASLTGDKTDKAADFKERLAEIDKNMASRIKPNEVLGQISRLMVPGAIVDQFNSKGGTLELVVLTDNFQTAAKQILNFKKSSYFHATVLKSIYKDTDGKVNVTLDTEI